MSRRPRHAVALAVQLNDSALEQLAAEAHFEHQLAGFASARHEHLRRLRREIQNGTYLTAGRQRAAVARLIEGCR